LGRVTEEVAVELQAIFPHVHRQAGRSQRRKPGVFLHGVEVPEPHNFVCCVGHRPVASLVDEPPDVPARIGQNADPVGTQGPDLPPAILVPLQGPECRPPQAEVNLGGPPQIAASVPRVHLVQKLLDWMGPFHGQPGAIGRAAKDMHGRAAQGVGPQLDGSVHRHCGGVIVTVFGPGPATSRSSKCLEIVQVAGGGTVASLLDGRRRHPAGSV